MTQPGRAEKCSFEFKKNLPQNIYCDRFSIFVTSNDHAVFNVNDSSGGPNGAVSV